MTDDQPKKRVFIEDVTVPDSSDRHATEGARILVFGQDDVVSHPLPEGNAVTVGRSIEADVYIKDPAMSRVHAVLRCDRPRAGGSGLFIRDLGSSNGTKVAGKRIPPQTETPIEAGDLIEFGRTTLVIQRGVTLKRPRRVWTHGYFELRLEDECTRARKNAGQFAVLRVRTKGSADAASVETALTAFLGASDLIALYAPSEYDILLAGSNTNGAEQAVAAVKFGLSRLGGEVSIGLACFPRDGQTPESLIAKAGAGVRGNNVVGPTTRSASLIVEDQAMKQLHQLVERVAGSDISVLILGETGVGKEILAKTIHSRSQRSSRPFLALNCGAFPQELLESELFGHERGAFTGAHKAKQGLLETAEGGSVFLDEIGEMPLPIQVRLLRVLEERQVRRLGGLENIPIDVRFISATNRDLDKEVTAGRFREDLYYRLNAVSLSVPPLRERRDEIPSFVDAFARDFLAREGLGIEPRFGQRAMSALLDYTWPGNVRELKNVIERALILAGNLPVDLEHLPLEKFSSSVVYSAEKLESGVPRPSEHTSPLSPDDMQIAKAETLLDTPSMLGPSSSLREQMGEFERDRIVKALEECSGNQTRAAEMLGMSRKTLLRRLDQYGISRPRKGRG